MVEWEQERVAEAGGPIQINISMNELVLFFNINNNSIVNRNELAVVLNININTKKGGAPVRPAVTGGGLDN